MLIANKSDVDIGSERYPESAASETKSFASIIKAILMLSSASKYLSVILADIFDLLLDAKVKQNKNHFRNYTNYMLYALYKENVNCIKKLINIGAPFDVIVDDGFYVWELVARMGDVGLLKCMFSRGFDKDTTNEDGVSVLWCVVMSGNIEAIRYLLDLGVVIPTYSWNVYETQCVQCKENGLIIDDANEPENLDPCLIAVCENKLEIVKLLDEYGSQSCKSFTALRCALTWNNVDVVSYLLKTYRYPINMEYILRDSGEPICTLLSEQTCKGTAQLIKLLLDHGADPAKPMCSVTSVNAIMTAINYGNVTAIVQYIRYGVDINCRSWNSVYKTILPFEASVLRHRHYIYVMLLISGSSRGMFSPRRFMTNPNPDLEKLMKEWKVYDNDVTPLMQRCRCVILNHLSPRADMKIGKLPLPPCLIKFLSIPELDNILYVCNKADQN